ncbi:MAG: acetyl coenzyme synthetase forming, alpha domain protein [Deltaproteobacteria bacterium]|nr:acetyl coenzyme synthetase forming, alpha domain protein [Deltaproteobacteria bacterium]
MLPKELFQPRSVAVVGASRNTEKVGYGVFANLVQAGFPGPLYGVNPGGGELLGRPLYPSVESIPGPVDLGVFVVSPKDILKAFPALAAKGMKAAIAISAGFKEVGGAGVTLERDLSAAAKASGIRVVGPNCLGVIDTHSRMNASFSNGTPAMGNIGFLSQSGALCTAILDRSMGDNIGFSKVVSMGNKADVSESDVLEYLANDPDTRVIMGYVESIDDGRRFLRVAKEVTPRKPVVLVKAGRTASGARAASSHTGSLAGSDSAYTAAFRQAGILRAESIEELYDFTVGFSMRPVPKDGQLLILTNAGGPGILAADTADRLGVRLAEVSESLRAKIAPKVPPTSSLVNPVDIIGDARADRYRDVLNAVAGEDSIDMVLVLLTPQVMTEPEETARAIVSALAATDKVVFASFVGQASVGEARKILMAGGIPSYIVPERAVSTAHAMVRYSRFHTSDFPEDGGSLGGRPMAAQRAVGKILRKGGQGGEEDSRAILEAYGFSFPRNAFAQTSADAVQAFREMGVPKVVMKIVSPQILHKTDVGGVRLNLSSEEEVAKAFVDITSSVRRLVPSAWIAGVSVQEMIVGGQELIIGLSRDPQFGPLLMFGLGGIYVEVLKDVAFRVAPLSKRDATEMIREIRAYPLLAGYRGTEPADEDAIVDALQRLSALSCDFPEIQELDINPIRVMPRGKGLRAIDCRISIAEARK